MQIRSETETARDVRTFTLKWSQAGIVRAGVLAVPCAAAVRGSDGDLYGVLVDALVISTRAVERPRCAFLNAAGWRMPRAMYSGWLIDQPSFFRACWLYLCGTGPDAAPVLPVESVDRYITPEVSPSAVTAASGWSVRFKHSISAGNMAAAYLGDELRQWAYYDGPRLSAIAELYGVPEVTRRAMCQALGGDLPAPVLEAV